MPRASPEACGFHSITIAKYEAGMRPSPEYLEVMARCVGLTVAEGDELLQLADSPAPWFSAPSA